MHDLLIMAGTALVGGLILDLQKRLSPRQMILAGLTLVPLGWIVALAMVPAGPFPFPAGSAAGFGLLMTGIALLSIPAFRARRNGDSGRRGSR